MHSLESNQPTKFFRGRLAVVGAVSISALLASACAADGAPEEQSTDETVLAQTVSPQPRDQGTSTSPSGPSVTNTRDDGTTTTPSTGGPSVTPNPRDNDGGTTPSTGGPTVTPNPRDNSAGTVYLSGNGCPAGSYTGSLSSDGLTATITANAFSVEIDEGQTSASTDCQILIRPATGGSYAISEVSIEGYAVIDAGSTATALARYWAGEQAEPSWAAARKASIVGPRTLNWGFRDSVSEADRAYTLCGGPNFLNASLSLRLDNGGTSTSFGFINGDKIVIKLATRTCGRGPTITPTRS